MIPKYVVTSECCLIGFHLILYTCCIESQISHDINYHPDQEKCIPQIFPQSLSMPAKLINQLTLFFFYHHERIWPQSPFLTLHTRKMLRYFRIETQDKLFAIPLPILNATRSVSLLVLFPALCTKLMSEMNSVFSSHPYLSPPMFFYLTITSDSTILSVV